MAVMRRKGDDPASGSGCNGEKLPDEWLQFAKELDITLPEGKAILFGQNLFWAPVDLPELRGFDWFDIMRLAAYRQHNPKIPHHAECFSTGRMKRGYGVEAMLRLLSDNRSYRESHNAFWDALDELEIMRLLMHPTANYIPL